MDTVSLLSSTDQSFFSQWSGSTVPGLGSVSGRVIKRVGGAVLSGVDTVMTSLEVSRIETFLRRDLDLPTKPGGSGPGDDKWPSVERMYHALFKLNVPGVPQALRSRTVKIVASQIGSLRLESMARAFVTVDVKWSSVVVSHIRLVFECCIRPLSFTSHDLHSQGYTTYILNRKPLREGVLAEPALLYLMLVVLFGTQDHAKTIVQLGIMDLLMNLRVIEEDRTISESTLFGRLFVHILARRLQGQLRESVLENTLVEYIAPLHPGFNRADEGAIFVKLVGEVLWRTGVQRDLAVVTLWNSSLQLLGAAPTTKNSGSMKVRRTFVPSMPDELLIVSGEMISVVQEFDDDWALCQNESGKQGMIPLECLYPMDDDPGLDTGYSISKLDSDGTQEAGTESHNV